MNFFEAMKELEQGKKVRHASWPDKSFYTLDKGKIQCYDREEIYNPIRFLHDIQTDENFWQIYEEPKESKRPMGLWHSEREPNGVEDLHTKHYVSCRNYVIRSQHDAWSAALETFMRLKGHPLAIPFDNSKLRVHYCIFHNPNGLNHKDIGVHLGMAGQGTQNISPSFSNFDDANQALKDIGPENLLHMFKTFSGIYE